MPTAQDRRGRWFRPPVRERVESLPMHAHPSSRSAGRPPARSMALTWASAVVPGLAHWVAGGRREAVVIFSLALALVIGSVVLVRTTPRTERLRLAVRPGWLTIVIVVAL